MWSVSCQYFLLLAKPRILLITYHIAFVGRRSVLTLGREPKEYLQPTTQFECPPLCIWDVWESCQAIRWLFAKMTRFNRNTNKKMLNNTYKYPLIRLHERNVLANFGNKNKKNVFLFYFKSFYDELLTNIKSFTPFKIWTKGLF